MAELTARERQLVKMLSDPVSWGHNDLPVEFDVRHGKAGTYQRAT